MVYLYNGKLRSHKKNEIMLLAATKMDLDMLTLSEVSQTKTSHVAYMWDLKGTYDITERDPRT